MMYDNERGIFISKTEFEAHRADRFEWLWKELRIKAKFPILLLPSFTPDHVHLFTAHGYLEYRQQENGTWVVWCPVKEPRKIRWFEFKWHLIVFFDWLLPKGK
jgi:hypothetical protein